MEKTLHLMTITPFLCNICHFVNAAGEIIGYVKHSDSSEVHEESDMIGIESIKPPLIGEHIFQGDERKEKLSFFHPCILV